MKKSIMSKIMTLVENVKETKDGHLLVSFAHKSNLEKAKNEIESETNLSVNEKGKLKPKIKVVYAHSDEEDIVNSITIKNPWIKNLIESSDDFKIIKEILTQDKKHKHYIIKCTPQIRKAIIDHNDKLYTMYSRCNVYDCYMPYQCYKCQSFGHSATNCKFNQVCPKCSGNHGHKDCTSGVLKCNNCSTRGYTETNHKTYDLHNCTVYKEEIAKVKNNTDHGI